MPTWSTIDQIRSGRLVLDGLEEGGLGLEGSVKKIAGGCSTAGGLRLACV